MPNMEMEMRIFSAFCRNNEKVLKKLPTRVKSYADEQSDEQLICVSRYSLDMLKKKKEGIADPLLRVQLFGEKRGEIEHFGEDRYQVVVAACIHSDKEVLLLKLNEAPEYIDGYHAGTLTYPQGHARFDAALKKFAYTGERHDMYPYVAFRQFLENEILRELDEEITIEAPELKKRFFDQLALTIRSKSIMYPIYVNHPGSTGRHLCIVFDVDTRHFMEAEWLHEIKSNEPRKHQTKICKYSDLLELPRLDFICTWVLASFSTVPFYSHEFLEDYLKVKVS